MNIGPTIKMLRIEAGITQERFAAAAGIAGASLSRIENGALPSAITMQKIAAALQVPVAFIYVCTVEVAEDLPANLRSQYELVVTIIRSLVRQMSGIATDSFEKTFREISERDKVVKHKAAIRQLRPSNGKPKTTSHKMAIAKLCIALSENNYIAVQTAMKYLKLEGYDVDIVFQRAEEVANTLLFKKHPTNNHASK